VIGQDGLLAKDGKIIVRENRATKQPAQGENPWSGFFMGDARKQQPNPERGL